MEHTIKLTDAEEVALSFVSEDPQVWIENAVHNRCRIAIDEILKIALEKSIEAGVTLPPNKEEIVILAKEKGWLVPPQVIVS